MKDRSNAIQRQHWDRTWADADDDVGSSGDIRADDGPGCDPRFRAILERLPQGSAILEAGCGRGQWVMSLEERGYRVAGVDYAFSGLTAARSGSPGLWLLAADVQLLPFPDSSFDAVLSWGVVEHFEDGPEAVLREMGRILRPSGLLFITVPCRNALYFDAILRMKERVQVPLCRLGLLRPKPGHGFYQYQFSRRGFLARLDSAGYEVQQTLPISHEVGFANAVNSYLLAGSCFLHKSKQGRWQGLSNIGTVICRALMSFSPWISPDQILCVAFKRIQPRRYS